MVFVNLSESEIEEMVESFFRKRDGSSRIYTNGAVREIVDYYCSFEEDGRIAVNLRDFLRYSVVFYETVEEAVNDGIELDEYSIIRDCNAYTLKSQVILIGG